MRDSRLGSPVLVLVATVAAASGNSVLPEDRVSTGERRPLAESGGESVPHVCVLPNCGTVLSVRHGDSFESFPPTSTQGPLRRNPPFGPYDPHVPPINQPSFPVQRQREVWVIEVRLRDGTVRSIEQSYPTLFHPGDEVIVEAEQVRAPD